MKQCFGDYAGKTCEDHHDCPVSGKCFGERSSKGPCDCPYKRSCHIPRQTLQTQFKKEDPNYICSFIKYFKKPELEE